MISIIAAVDENGTYGINNQLPWQFHQKKIKEDMRRFKKRTETHVVIMGKETFLSMGGRPLPNRENIVVSKTMQPGSGYLVVPSLFQACKRFPEKELFLIGGKGIWTEGISHFAEEAFITEVRSKFSYEGEQVHQLPLLLKLDDETNLKEEAREQVLDEPSGLICEFVHYVHSARNQPK